MTRRLGELLVEKGECPRAAIEEALRAQAVFGGRLGTNLLEIGAITEERLAHALGEQHHLPALHGDLLPEPEALDLISSDDADRWEVVPLRAPGRKLVLLTLDPGNLAALDEVAFATGRSVHPFVVPEARLWRLLARSYGLFREERGIDHHPHAAGARALPAGAGQDLIDEAEFDALYGRVGLTTPPPFPRPVPAAGAGRPGPGAACRARTGLGPRRRARRWRPSRSGSTSRSPRRSPSGRRSASSRGSRSVAPSPAPCCAMPGRASSGPCC